MKILFFAQLNQATGVREVELPVADPLTGQDLWTLLRGRYPALARVQVSLRIARDGEFVSWDTELTNDNEVVFIPPVSGG